MVSNITDQERDQRIEELRQALTVRQEKFCQGILDGLEQAEAYRQAYPTCKSDGAAYANASRALRNDKMRSYVSAVRSQRAMQQAHKRDQEDHDRVLSRQSKREILASIAWNEEHPANSRISAVSVDNAMTGDNEPVRVEFTLSGIVSALRGTTDLPAAEVRNVKDGEENDKVCSTNGNGQNGNGGNGGHS